MSSIFGHFLLDLVGVIVAIFAVIYAYIQWIFQIWKRKGIPYLEPRFPVGNRQLFGKKVSIGIDVFNIVQRAKERDWRYFGMFLGAKSFFVPLDLDMIKNILTKDFNHFTDRGIYYNEKDDPLSGHLFAIGGIKWRNLRMKLTPTFTSGKLRGMFQTLVGCGLVLERALKEHDTTEPLDIKYILACYSTDIIGSCAFGLDCNSFTEVDSPFVRYGRRITQRTQFEQFKTLFMFAFPELSRALHLKMFPADITNFFYEVVRKTVNFRETNNIVRHDFLQLLIDIRNHKGSEQAQSSGDGTTLTMDEMVAQCFVFFLAGFETSATTMTFALYELSVHPDIQEKVREELFRVLEKYNNEICYDALKELEYMQQVIDETLRKYPPVPFITRQCVQEYRIPETEVILEKKTSVLIPVRNIHYDESIYEDPTEFDPERFSAENKQKRNQYAHIPFGEGPRMCIGMRFGLMQSKVGLATLLRNFRVTLSSKTKTPLEMDWKSFIPSTLGGMWLNVEKL